MDGDAGEERELTKVGEGIVNRGDMLGTDVMAGWRGSRVDDVRPTKLVGSMGVCEGTVHTWGQSK